MCVNKKSSAIQKLTDASQFMMVHICMYQLASVVDVCNHHAMAIINCWSPERHVFVVT